MARTNDQVIDGFVNGTFPGDRVPDHDTEPRYDGHLPTRWDPNAGTIASGNGNLSYTGRGLLHPDDRDKRIGTGRYLPVLYTYRTPLAVRLNEREIAVNPNRYSVTSSAHLSELESALYWAGFEETDRTFRYPRKEGFYVPPTSYRDEDYQWAFTIYRRKPLPKLSRERRDELRAIRERKMRVWKPGAGDKVWDDYSRWMAKRRVREIDAVLDYRRRDSGVF